MSMPSVFRCYNDNEKYFGFGTARDSSAGSSPFCAVRAIDSVHHRITLLHGLVVLLLIVAG